MEAADGERVPVPAAPESAGRLPRLRIGTGTALPGPGSRHAAADPAVRLPDRNRRPRRRGASFAVLPTGGPGGVARLGVEEPGDAGVETADDPVVRSPRRRTDRRSP